MTGPLFSDNFGPFPIGLLPHDYSPLGEYHCVVPEGHRGDWLELTVHHSWRGVPAWLIAEEEGNKFLEHGAVREGIPSILSAGEMGWQDYQATAKMRLLADDGMAGIACRLQNGRCYYLLTIVEGRALRLSQVHFEEMIPLAEHRLPDEFDTEAWHALSLSVESGCIEGTLDGQYVIRAEDDRFPCGQIALVATAPAQFDDVEVTALGGEAERFSIMASRQERELADRRESFPAPVLWRRIELGDSGAGKSVRFGDVDGDGELEILMAQNLKRMGSGDFGMISCVTAFKLTGEVLWQIGEPNPGHALLTADLPVQIHDIDGDGENEVVLCKDFRIQIREGSTGKLKNEVPSPTSLPSHQWLKEDVYRRIVGDSICFADLRGRGQPRDLLIKDRYSHVWAYSAELEPLWCHACETGHYPFPWDVDGDGRDEVFVGSTLLDEDGKPLWSVETDDHVDTIAVARLAEGADPVVLLAAGDAGLYALDLAGTEVFHDRSGHMQDITVGRFRDDVDGLQFFTKTFWGYPGIVFLYDASLRRLLTMQGYPLGFCTFPVNWAGDGKELIFASPHPRFGGLYDGWGRNVVALPDDGHPHLCWHPLNVTGDPRDELLCWNERELWIYTQDCAPDGPRIYAPRRLPLHNFSNYRGEISLPAWVDALPPDAS